MSILNRSDEKKIEHSTMEIASFPAVFKGKIIETIVNEENKNTWNYVEGYFHVNYLSEKNHSCTYELYFRDKNEKIFKVEGQSKLMTNDELTPEARKELAEEKIITFEIPEPSKAERDVYSGEVSLKDAFRKIFDQLVTQKK